MTRIATSLFFLLFAIAQAPAAVVLQLATPTGPTHVAGANVPIDLWLTGTRDTVIASIELEFEPAPSGTSFVAVGPNTDGFAESSVLLMHLNAISDGSLVDNPSVGFASGVGMDGVPMGSEDLLLGTLWVQTHAGVEAQYRVGIDAASIDVLDAELDSVSASGASVTFQTVVPEPATLGLIAAVGSSLLRRPRARRKV